MMHYDGQQLEAILANELWGGQTHPMFVHISDGDYAVPTRWWLERTFFPYLKGIQSRYECEWDCDDFALELLYWARRCHNRSNAGIAEGIAVGEVWYVAPGGAHAINCALCDEGLVFIEPQAPAIVELTEGERWSVWYVRF